MRFYPSGAFIFHRNTAWHGPHVCSSRPASPLCDIGRSTHLSRALNLSPPPRLIQRTSLTSIWGLSLVPSFPTLNTHATLLTPLWEVFPWSSCQISCFGTQAIRAAMSMPATSPPSTSSTSKPQPAAILNPHPSSFRQRL